MLIFLLINLSFISVVSTNNDDNRFNVICSFDSISMSAIAKNNDLINKKIPSYDFKPIDFGYNDITAISRNVNLYDIDIFVFVFSVTEDSQGNVMPDERLSQEGFYHNILEQNLKGQHAGDAFVSTTFYTRKGIINNDNPYNSNLAINNFDEGGRDFAGDGPSADIKYLSVKDNVDALDISKKSSVFPLYFVTSSKNDIFAINEDMVVSCYASNDGYNNNKIDSLIVCDYNNNYIFDEDDVIFVSFEKSPDIFSITIDDGINLFTSADFLGLKKTDDIDALSLIVIDKNDDYLSVSQKYGIK